MPSDSAPTLEVLKSWLQSDDLGDRLRAINQARPLPTGDLYELLCMGAQDPSPRVRYAALSQVGSLSLSTPTDAAPMLRQALKADPEPDVRAAAAAALGSLHITDAYEDLVAAYENETEWLVQFSVIAAVGELGNTDAFDLLVTALSEGSDLIRTAAAGALGDLGDPRAIPVLETYITAEDWQLRHRVGIALSQIGGEAVRPGLIRLSQDEVDHVATHAADALQALGS